MPIQNEDDMIQIDYDKVITDTSLAWLLDIDDDRVWVPKSRCAIVGDVHKLEGYCLMPEWLAFEKSLI